MPQAIFNPKDLASLHPHIRSDTHGFGQPKLRFIRMMPRESPLTYLRQTGFPMGSLDMPNVEHIAGAATPYVLTRDRSPRTRVGHAAPLINVHDSAYVCVWYVLYSWSIICYALLAYCDCTVRVVALERSNNVHNIVYRQP